MRGLDQDGAARIEAETVEAMSGQPSALPRLIARHYEKYFLFPPPTRVAFARA
jgi:hypothetical protein